MEKTKKQKITFWSIIVACILILLSLFFYFAYQWSSNIQLTDVVQNEIVQEQIKKRVRAENRFLLSLAPTFLGFHEPKTVLLLFLNNTELRPGGGFIGSYATIRVDQGRIEVLTLQGVEKLDNQTPKKWKPKPPEIIKDELKVDRWYFRDSNWSPDFAKSSRKGLKFYQKEGGVAADKIDFVVGITTTVLEEVIRTVGPVEAEGIEFTADNIIRKLQYRVHYGFKERGLSFRNRKQIMKPLFRSIVGKVQANLLDKYDDYLDLVREMLEEKHIIVYAQDENLQEKLSKEGYTGEVKRQPKGDYLMWVDANLAALKTDHAINRDLNYSIKEKNEKLVATVTMKYDHTSGYDWRTSKYRTFARVYTHKNSELLSAKINGDEVDLDKIKQGKELNKKWFGKLTIVEPKNKKSLTYSYILPEKIKKQIREGSYSLLVQKQIGTNKPKLTLSLDFDKNIKDAKPSELKENWGNDIYSLSTNLNKDRNFRVKF
ncbi:MAG: DUF4012 domain-containing protein [Candidatus Magasanikbacteria bacterium]